MGVLILLVIVIVSLLMIPLGLPGIWVMLAGAIGYNLLVPNAAIGWISISVMLALAFIAEWMEFSLAARYAKKYGGSRRAGWGAMLGGIIGAIVGLPVPIIGSVLGAFAGSFAGALLAEYSRAQQAGVATRVAWGALIGRVMAAVVKTGIGCVIGAWLVVAAWAH
jgi:uncharacterized protein YqgC (DUF456 family)